MALRKIVTEGDPVLRKRAREVEKINNKERMIFDDMVETMRASNGCGLAGPQVGLLKRMIVVEVPDPQREDGFNEEGLPIDEDFLKEDPINVEDSEREDALKEKASGKELLAKEEVEQEIKLIVYQLANPEVLSMSGSQIGEEGCLSVPGFTGKVDRPEAIHIKALDYDGKPIEIKATGLLAVALCHEIDHLNGVLFTDKATDIEEIDQV